MSSHGSENDDKVMSHDTISIAVVVIRIARGARQAAHEPSGESNRQWGREETLYEPSCRAGGDHTDYAAEARRPIKAGEALPITVPWPSHLSHGGGAL